MWVRIERHNFRSPPSIFGCWHNSCLTQCTEGFPWELSQKKFMIKELNFRRVTVGIWYTDKQWWQSAAMTLLMRSSRLARDRSLAFHPCIFRCSFSIKGSNAYAFHLLSCVGNPRYFPKELSTFVEKMDCIMVQWYSCVLGESIINDLFILMISPDAWQNSLMYWFRIWHYCWCTVVKKTTSLAKRRWLIGGAARDILTPRHEIRL